MRYDRSCNLRNRDSLFPIAGQLTSLAADDYPSRDRRELIFDLINKNSGDVYAMLEKIKSHGRATYTCLTMLGIHKPNKEPQNERK